MASSHFEHLFEGLHDRVVGFVPLDGNAGDKMIQAATLQLFDTFGIQYFEISDAELQSGRLSQPVDELVVSGGGSMGVFWPVPLAQRKQALGFKLPVTIFPQSFINDKEDTSHYHKIFVRERVSQALCNGSILAPDMALALNLSEHKFSAPEIEYGLLLRTDRESTLKPNPLSLVDPILIAESVTEYLELASLFEKIVTDRLHFAIAGMTLGRDVTLLPNGYHKNHSMHETWLSNLGCQWLEHADSISYDKKHAECVLWQRFEKR